MVKLHGFMEFPMVLRAPTTNPTPTTSAYCCSRGSVWLPERLKKRRYVSLKRAISVRATVERNGGEGIDTGERKSAVAGGGGSVGASYTSSAMEVTTFNQTFPDAEFPVWDKIGAVVRLSYGIGIYGAMAFVGNFICSTTGIDSTGGYSPSLDAIVQGLGYAAPPIMALLFILDDEVVKVSPHARAIRDVEDEELRSFFYGMSPWQFILIVAASSVGEELFYRAAVQVH